MANKKEQLFELIQSLNKQEKRYFILFASRNSLRGKSNYVTLFRAIAAQKEYDEASLKEKFKNENFTRNFAGTKYHLYHAILKSLHAFHLGRTVESRLSLKMDIINILYNKGLTHHAPNFIASGMDEAVQSNKMLRAVEFLNYRIFEFAHQDFRGVAERDIQNLIQEQRDVLKEYLDLTRYSEAYFQISRIHYQNANDSKAKRSAMLLPYFKSVLLTKDAPPAGFYHQLYYLPVKIIEDEYVSGASTHSAQLVKLLEENEFYIHDYPLFYATTLHNHIMGLMDNGKFKEAEADLKKLLLLARNDKQRIHMEETASSSIKAFYLNSVAGLFQSNDRPEEGVKIVETFLKRFPISSIKASDFLMFQVYFNVGMMCFMAEKMEKSLSYINYLVNKMDGDVHPVIFVYARVMQAVIHHELRNYNLVENLAVSCRRMIKNKYKQFRYEEELISFTRSLARYYSATGTASGDTRKLKTAAAALGKQLIKRSEAASINLTPWVEKKLKVLGS